MKTTHVGHLRHHVRGARRSATSNTITTGKRVTSRAQWRHPRYVHACFQRYLKQQGLRAPIRKTCAGWLSRMLTFHRGCPAEHLQAHHIDHFMEFLTLYAELDEQQLYEAHCSLKLFYQGFLPDFIRRGANATMQA